MAKFEITNAELAEKIYNALAEHYEKFGIIAEFVIELVLDEECSGPRYIFVDKE